MEQSPYEKTERQRETIHSLIPENQPESAGSATGFLETGGGAGVGVAAGMGGSGDGVGGDSSCGIGIVAGSNGFGAGDSNEADDVMPVTVPSRTFF